MEKISQNMNNNGLYIKLGQREKEDYVEADYIGAYSGYAFWVKSIEEYDEARTFHMAPNLSYEGN